VGMHLYTIPERPEKRMPIIPFSLGLNSGSIGLSELFVILQVTKKGCSRKMSEGMSTNSNSIGTSTIGCEQVVSFLEFLNIFRDLRAE